MRLISNTSGNGYDGFNNCARAGRSPIRLKSSVSEWRSVSNDLSMRCMMLHFFAVFPRWFEMV
jgi:hypothetical protein